MFLAPFNVGATITPTWRADDAQTANLALFASCLLASLVLTPNNSGRLLRTLEAVTGTRGGSYREYAAASVAALLSNKPAAATLAQGTERFRALPLASLTPTELANSTPAPTMYAKTQPATLGKVHAFVSHSWADDGGGRILELQHRATASPSTSRSCGESSH